MTSTSEQRTARERTTIALEQMLADLTNLEAMGLMLTQGCGEVIGESTTPHSRARLATLSSTQAQLKAAIAEARKPA
jgi:hypothetical protein